VERQVFGTGVDLDARNDTFLLERVGKWRAVIVLLADSFIKQYNATQKLFITVGR
jgi:hypothetical protein